MTHACPAGVQGGSSSSSSSKAPTVAADDELSQAALEYVPEQAIDIEEQSIVSEVSETERERLVKEASSVVHQMSHFPKNNFLKSAKYQR